MKNNILKILGILALSTLSMNTMADKGTLDDGSPNGKSVTILNHRLWAANAPQCNVQNATIASEMFVQQNKMLHSRQDGEKANCLKVIYNGNQELYVGEKSLTGANESLILALIDFMDITGGENLSEEFTTKINSVIASYKLAKLLGISRHDISRAGSISNFINLALDRVNFIGDDGREVPEQIKNDLQKAKDINKAQEAFKAILLANVCLNKCESDPRKIVTCFFGTEKEANKVIIPSGFSKLTKDELSAIKNVRNAFLVHSCKHMAPMEVVARELKKGNIGEKKKIDVLVNSNKFTILFDENGNIDTLERAQERLEQLLQSLAIKINDFQSPLSRAFNDLRFNLKDGTARLEISRKTKGNVTIDGFEESTLIPMIDEDTNNFADIGLEHFHITQAVSKDKSPRLTQAHINDLENAREYATLPYTWLFFKFVIPFVSKGKQEYGSVFPIIK